jgi:hypothetical protein
MVKFIELDGIIYNVDDIVRISRRSDGLSKIYISGNKERFWSTLNMTYEEVKQALGFLVYDPKSTPEFVKFKG